MPETSVTAITMTSAGRGSFLIGNGRGYKATGLFRHKCTGLYDGSEVKCGDNESWILHQNYLNDFTSSIVKLLFVNCFLSILFA